MLEWRGASSEVIEGTVFPALFGYNDDVIACMMKRRIVIWGFIVWNANLLIFFYSDYFSLGMLYGQTC